MDALRIVPGMEIQKISSTESSASLRSYTASAASSQGVQGLVNGRQVYNEFFGGVFWENIPVTLSEIKSIEVVRGPGSFIYGPNAMHGLVNIQTYSPLDYFADSQNKAHELVFQAEGGTYESNSENLIFVHGDQNTAIKVKVAHDDIAEFDTLDDTRNKYFMELSVESRLGQGMKVLLTAGAARQDFDALIPTTATGPQGSLLIPPGTFATHSNEFYVQGVFVVAAGANEFKAQVDWSRFDASGVPDQVYSPFSVILDTVDLDLQYRFTPLEAHTATVGTGVRTSTFDTSDLDVSMGRHSTWQAWGFVQDEVELSRRALYLTAGARVDQHSTAGTTIAPRAALVWQFAGQDDDPKKNDKRAQSIRITAGYGFQNPSLRDLWFDMPVSIPTPLGPVPGTIGSNRDLKPQELKSFEIGYWGRPKEWVQLEASTYYNRGDRLTQFQMVNSSTLPPPVFARENVGHEDAYGVEMNFEVAINANLYAFGNYSYEIRRDRDNGYNRIPGGPKNKASAGIRILPVPDHASLGAMVWGTFYDESEFQEKGDNGANLGGVPAYTLLNLRVWYPFKVGNAEGRVYLQGFNLLDHVHKEHPDGDAYGLIGSAGVELFW
jgi:iron complex outermembrane receptor protein